MEHDVQQESQSLLQEFIDHIKFQKVVVLEELATAFGLKTPEVIMRLRGLQEMGMLTGVMDDKGKFIYISLDEMQRVAAFIQRKGRVSIADLALESNKMIDLEPKKLKVELPEINLDDVDALVGPDPAAQAIENEQDKVVELNMEEIS
eukprot:c2183_g1_i1.p3 GENE.c2183_g1_i1~~c2183_g1_i1.p3  ORF type:complete len:148 (+),score=52.73 c2183_g1_i1:610-1053(+)